MRRLEAIVAAGLLAVGAAGMAWRIELAGADPARAAAQGAPLLACPLAGVHPEAPARTRTRGGNVFAR
jgi:hypothetical protein